MNHLSDIPCLYLVAYRLYTAEPIHIGVFLSQSEVEDFASNPGVIVFCVDTLKLSLCFGKEVVDSEDSPKDETF